MRAVTWHGKNDVRVEQVPDPEILSPGDVIVRITSTAICGSDLHLYNGYIPSMMPGDILGHEFMGEVVEVGSDVKRFSVGDRVVVPFTISCGQCFYCERKLWSLCDNTNPKPELAETLFGYTPAGIYGYSHLMGGYAGGQAEYARVPFADHGPIKVPESMPDEQLLFLTDIFPTGYQAAEYCDIQEGDTVAVFGAGPVGQFAIKSAFLLGAEQVVAIDRVPERLQMAAESGARTLDYTDADVVEALKDLTGGRGPDSCIDAVGMEAHGTGVMGVVDRAKQAVRIETDRPHALRQAIQACRKGGTLSIPGVYGGFIDSVNMGAAFNKGLTFKMGQTHVQNYLEPLLEEIDNGRIDPSFVITHQLPLDQAPEAYRMFRDKQDGCIKVVLKP
ncbi:MAG TPA: zinc-dependent alcohol dehydrogenase [Thermomicrobiales bacterium]|nr:zinc-dependent alcohol dehydrogenase [Thermomicrobiales bacterium]